MVKLRKSLLGLKASGPLGDQLTLSTHGKQVRVGRRPHPFNPQTNAQVSHRTLFLSGIEFWHTLTDAEKRVYAAINPRIGANPGYLNFMSLWLEGNVPYDRGEGNKFYHVWLCESVIQGAWSSWGVAATPFANVTGNTNHDDGDAVQWKDYLDAGTYTLLVLAQKTPEGGIVKFFIDDVEVATFDTYDVGWLSNIREVEAGIVIATPGLKTIKAVVTGKNPASTNHYFVTSAITLWRTA